MIYPKESPSLLQDDYIQSGRLVRIQSGAPSLVIEIDIEKNNKHMRHWMTNEYIKEFVMMFKETRFTRC
jgi:hypothetical protein